MYANRNKQGGNQIPSNFSHFEVEMLLDPQNDLYLSVATTFFEFRHPQTSKIAVPKKWLAGI